MPINRVALEGRSADAPKLRDDAGAVDDSNPVVANVEDVDQPIGVDGYADFVGTEQGLRRGSAVARAAHLASPGKGADDSVRVDAPDPVIASSGIQVAGVVDHQHIRP